MDSAVYAATANVIVGIRGNRLFQCSPTTGAVQLTADIGTFGRNGCLAYDVGSNKIFAAVWNNPHYDIQLVGGFNIPISNRTLYRINPATLAIELTADITTSFSLTSGAGHPNDLTAQEAGICAMEPYSVNTGGTNYIYCRWWACFITGGLTGGVLRFSAAAIGTFSKGNGGALGGYPNVVYANVAGNDNAIIPDQEGGPQVGLFDFTANVENTINVTNPKNMLAVGFAPSQQHVFVSDVAQKIYVYSTAGALLATIDTGRSTFNGLAIRYNSSDGNIYVAGGNDNTVCQINPTTNTFTIITGFDAPIDFCFTPTTRFAVQAGITPLKSF